MNFTGGIIVAVGVLVAGILGMIAIDPGYLAEPPLEPADVAPVPAIPMTANVSIPEGSGVMGCEETNECYIPYEVTILQGGTIFWTNDDTAAHTVTSGTPEGGSDGIFDSSLFMAGNTFEYTFDEEGEYDYFCVVHPWMTGRVIVS